MALLYYENDLKIDQYTIQYARNEQPGVGTIHCIKFGKRIASLMNSAALINSETFGPATRNLDVKISNAFQTIHDRNADGYTGNARNQIINMETAKTRPFVENFIAVAKEARNNHQVRKSRVQEFNRDAEPNAALRSYLRAWLMQHSPSERIGIALESDYSLAVSIYKAGQRVAGLDNATWNKFLDHYIALNHIRKAGLDSAYALQSTPNFITNAGMDHEAVYRAANQAVQKFHKDEELLEIAETYTQSIIAALVPLTGKSASEFIGT